MIRAFTGRPGSGKTYRVVYELRKLSKKYFVFHNIPNLKIEGNIRNFEDFCKERNIQLSTFFTNDFMNELTQSIMDDYGLNLLLVIDECYRWIGTRKSEECDRDQIQAMLAQHRHNGIDIWFIFQAISQIYKPFRDLFFERIHAKSGKVIPWFMYDHYEGSDKYGSSKIPKKPEIFSLYSSFKIQSFKVQRSNKFYYLVGGIVLCVIVVIYVFYQVTFGKLNRIENHNKTKHSVASISDSTSSSILPPQASISPQFTSSDFKLVAFSKYWCFFSDKSGRIERISDGYASINNRVVYIPQNNKILKIPFNFSLNKSDCYFDFSGIPARNVFKLFCEIFNFNYDLFTYADFQIDAKASLSFSQVSSFFHNIFKEKGFVICPDRGVYRLLGGDPDSKIDEKNVMFANNAFKETLDKEEE